MNENRTKLIDDIRRSLGNSMVDVELDPEDYHLAIDKAIQRFRKLSDNATEESHMFLDLSEDTNTFILPDEVIEVQQVFRRSVGTPGSGGTEVDPFELAYTNIYMLQAGSAAYGGIATYYMFSIYQEELGKMFGFFINFIWDPYTKKLQLLRRPIGNETVLLWVHNDKPEIALINDRYIGPWIRDWAITECKEMLGQAYRKFSTIAGPQGGTSLPGSEMIAEAKERQAELREELRNFENGETPTWFVIG